MLCRAAVFMGLATAAWGLTGAADARAQGLGWTTSPSTFWQRVGYGFGAGHHAPIVRTPMQEPPRQPRKTVAPSCYGQLGPSPLMMTGCSATRGSGGCGCNYGTADHGVPSGEVMLAPPTATPDPMPSPAPARSVLPTPPMPTTTATDPARGEFRQAVQYRWP